MHPLQEFALMPYTQAILTPKNAAMTKVGHVGL